MKQTWICVRNTEHNRTTTTLSCLQRYFVLNQIYQCCGQLGRNSYAYLSRTISNELQAVRKFNFNTGTSKLFSYQIFNAEIRKFKTNCLSCFLSNKIRGLFESAPLFKKRHFNRDANNTFIFPYSKHDLRMPTLHLETFERLALLSQFEYRSIIRSCTRNIFPVLLSIG